MQANNFLRRLIIRTVSKRTYTGIQPKVSYNDLPSPQGSWQTHNDASQRKHNAQLAFGALFLIGSVVFAKSSGILYFNYTIPKPAERN